MEFQVVDIETGDILPGSMVEKVRIVVTDITTPASVWTISHGENSNRVVGIPFELDVNGNYVETDFIRFQILDNNTVATYLPADKTGRMVLIFFN